MRKKRTKNLWTADQDTFMRENYPDMATEKIAKALNLSITSVYSRANTLKLAKSESFLNSEASGRLSKVNQRGAAHRFKKGHAPINKGKPMSEETKARLEHTFFKKGNKPHNTKFDGAVSIRNHKGTDYAYIRVKDSEWHPLHRYNWKQINGDIPDGMNLVFKDRNTLNCEVSNLELISNEELMKRNSIHNYPEDLVEIIRINSKIKRKIKKIEEHGQKQNNRS